MRLTLRTLLAYMDGLLDAKDSQEIGKKIEDSKFAKDLFHKIRDVMRRLRLGAPSLTERAANLDCNTVAEYLDNALPSDRVPDFEEVSLKSEVHLAEVASCHQILTMVLGEPVEIDPDSRQRMYQLPTVANRVDEERVAAAEAANLLSADGNGPVPPVPLAKARPRPVVPEYLRDPPKKSRLLLAAAIMLLVGAASGLVALTFNPKGAQWLVAKLQGKSTEDEDRDVNIKRSGALPGNSTDTHAAAGSGSGAAAKDSSLLGAAKDSSNPLPARSSGAEGSVPPVPTANAPAVGKGSESAIGPGLPVAPGTSSGTANSTAPTTNPAVTNPAATIPVIGQKPSVSSVAGTETKPGQTNPLPSGGTIGSTMTPGLKPDVVPPAAGPATPPPNSEDKLKIGHFMSDRDVLLKLDANNNGWRRMLPEEFIAGHQPLLALPSYRPRLAVLNVGAMLELVNGTRIELLPDNAQGQQGVDVDFGRVVIKPLAQAGARLRVVAGSHAGTITLTNLDSISGLEVTRVHDPGTDPEKVFSHALTKLYVARGGVIWEDAEGNKPPLRLVSPAELTLDGAAGTPPGSVKEVPKWITTNTVNESDQRAAISVSQSLSPQRAASLGLMELTDDRRIEIRWLAARCLGYLGQFDPLTAALNDSGFRREWPDYIDQLKEAIARGPETAAGIRQSLEKQYGNESDALYRMLWGYTDKQLEDGEDAKLVKFLDHESPVFRVLAFWNLQDITHATHGYRPEYTAAKRLTSVQLWRKQQQLGRIRFNVPDTKPHDGETPDKKTVPAPPKPREDAAADEVTPVSALEPVPPQPANSPGVNRADRLPVVVPEPNPAEKRPPLVVPEPQPSGQ
jgi:hypothetical protein